MSPTRPPSIQKRRSIQQIRDLEARLDQLASENRLLAAATVTAEKQAEEVHFHLSRVENASQEVLGARELALQEKDAELEKLKETLEWMQKELTKLTAVNEGLASANQALATTHAQLESQHNQTHTQWQDSSRELETLRSQHQQLSSGMEEIVRHEIDTALAAKNAELHQLYSNLEMAKEKIRELQQEILASKNDEIISARDEDYFDGACQQLCQHVQQWVLRFSKFSDTRICRSTNEVRDDKIVEKFENAVVDGSDVDFYLADRVKRRDVFMSVVMNMIWEYIFSRYLFGMDREQRQKLKQLEKNLLEVGPRSAVQRWRAMTLTILSRRETFADQRAKDTEAVAQEIFGTLARFLPPPQNLEKQILDSLRNVMKLAVDLSVEMRTQRAEYIMLPPLQPEYDPKGDLKDKFIFNAALMNERSGETTSNADLEAQKAVVRMVLFPLVVKKGNDDGEGDEELVVCPAQVLVARPGREKAGKKAASRVVSSDRMSFDQKSMKSTHSVAPSTLDMGNVI
jgi:archaellum component FlaC